MRILTDFLFVEICKISVLRVLFSPFCENLSFEFSFGAKVQQQTYLHLSCFEIVYQLSFMRLGNFVGSFQFKNNFIIYEEVSKILANRLTFIENLDRNLLFYRMTAFHQFFGKRVFINLLKKAITKRIVNVIEGVDGIGCYLLMKHRVLPIEKWNPD